MVFAHSLAAFSVSLRFLSLSCRECRALDVEQVHVSVVGPSGVCISWASPGNASASLTVEEVETGSVRVLQPMATSYRYEPSDGMGGAYGMPGVEGPENAQA